MSEHAYVVLFISACACELACAAHECVDMQMHTSKKFWCPFTCTWACMHVGRGGFGAQRRRCPCKCHPFSLGCGLCVVCLYISMYNGGCMIGRVITNDNKMGKAGGWKAKLAQTGMPGPLCSQGGRHSVLTAGPSAEL